MFALLHFSHILFTQLTLNIKGIFYGTVARLYRRHEVQVVEDIRDHDGDMIAFKCSKPPFKLQPSNPRSLHFSSYIRNFSRQ